jgi:MarR family transcriptional regulator, transcriptional regulator for hemolysin
MATRQGAPIGLQLSRTARLVGRAFDDALVTAGGSLAIWLVLLNLKIRTIANQRELAAAVGITEATLTHHLNAMDDAGLLTRRRGPDNRRAHVIELTPDGETAFLRLRDVAMAFDQQLRAGIADAEISRLARTLERLADNVSGEEDEDPWVGLVHSGPPPPGPSTRSPGRARTARTSRKEPGP